MPAPSIQAQRKIVEQLRQEAQVNRKKVSECVEDLKKYCEDHRHEDVLLIGSRNDKNNPYKDRSVCFIF